MMSVDCCLSSTPRSPISSTGSGSHFSCTLGESKARRWRSKDEREEKIIKVTQTHLLISKISRAGVEV